jgi:hypothetical protein
MPPEGITLLPREGLAPEDLQLVYDTIVLTNPLYQLDPERSPPAAVAALRDSKRLLVPDIARRDYERAREVFQAGEYDRAFGEAARVARMLDDLGAGVAPAALREAVAQLLTRVEAAQAQEDQRVYTIADTSVTPPAALSRQLPVTPPAGVSNLQVGTLEMVISEAGQVEAVKLHTPLNRYHERMIVSAAKAWKYRPAMKNGRPVRFRLVSSINLPES